MIIRRVAVVVAVAAVVAGPAGVEPAAAADDAATVNEAMISVDEFDEFLVALEDAGLTDFVANESSSTVGGDPGRAALSLLVTNEAQRQFASRLELAELTDEDREAAMASTPQDHPIRQNPAAFQAIADDAAYRARLDSLEAPDVDSLSEQYEESPASLGAYCATALTVADVDEAEAMIDDYGNGDDPSWDAVAANAGAAVSDWQCTPLSSVTDPNLLASLADAGPGEAVGPVRTADGYTVLVIDEFVDAAPKLESLFLRLEAEGTTSVGFLLFQGFLLDSDIAINSRYGRWDPTTISVVPLGT